MEKLQNFIELIDVFMIQSGLQSGLFVEQFQKYINNEKIFLKRINNEKIFLKRGKVD